MFDLGIRKRSLLLLNLQPFFEFTYFPFSVWILISIRLTPLTYPLPLQ